MRTVVSLTTDRCKACAGQMRYNDLCIMNVCNQASSLLTGECEVTGPYLAEGQVAGAGARKGKVRGDVQPL
jgi:hypothetical protein